MTTNDNAGNKGGSGGKDQRPHATLDLKAEDLSQGTAHRSTYGTASSPSGAQDAKSRLEHAPRSNSDDGGGGSSFLTHMAAGVVGALLVTGLFYAGGMFNADRDIDAGAQIIELRGQLDKAGQRLATLEKAPQAQAPDLSPLTAEIENTGQQLGDLKTQLTQLGGRVTSIENRPEQQPAITAESIEAKIEPLNSQLSTLQSRLDEMQGRVEQFPALQSRLDELQGRVEKFPDLQSRVESIAQAQSRFQSDSRAAALAMALYNLRRATDEGKPFTEELQAISTMAPIQLDLKALEAHGNAGVRNLEQLQSDFQTAANSAIDAENEPEDETLTSNIWSQAKSLVRIRRKGNVEGDTTRAILARAEFQLMNNNLAGAIAEAGQLKGAAGEQLQPWLAQAKARIAAEEALVQIEAKILTAVGGDASGKRGG